MIKVITYGTYDLLHFGHIRLLQRAKELGDYLIVGVTADDFDKTRGKINVQQSLIERIEAVKATGIADEIIVEEYEGQKIDDIKHYGIDIFTVGSDWKGKFDYLNEYCKVVYLDRTEGISSSEIRSEQRMLSVGLVGTSAYLNKVIRECSYVNGIKVVGICADNLRELSKEIRALPLVTENYEEMLEKVDAVYIYSYPGIHYEQIKMAIDRGKHVLCESPVTMSQEQTRELFQLAAAKKVVLMEALKTAYATAFSRLLLVLKSGKIGKILSVDATCTSLRQLNQSLDLAKDWSSITEWGPTALLPIFYLFGAEYKEKRIATHYLDSKKSYDLFTKIDFIYPEAVASIKVGIGVKSEGELIISGTTGYAYVPAPWWKTDYFEIRYEDPVNNRRYFYQLDGEGIRHELVAFVRAINSGKVLSNIDEKVTEAISKVMEDFCAGRDLIEI